ncbi:hypothetical protein [Phytomonospora endophytica]|uniref:DUF1963 domain-containing protein n=1 Tax=Phytomonospora endophytica TaxID=714109 RepID=A0A841FGS7_9ACTN|nr:hypothetical protein [Phytomonospora endophytica]MBB6036521.1 hypothetical protein [Phytomonospora endophytica]GIG65843.1 hypothetical protein Pen01_21380 [Phytomonospora endophytica]
MGDDLEKPIARAIRRRDGDLYELAETAPERLTPFLPRLIAAGVVYPATLFRAADTAARRALIDRIDAGDPDDDLNHLLMALVQSSGPETAAAFLHWRDDPPPRAGELLVAPAHYLREGGRELDVDEPRELCSPSGYSLHTVDGPQIPEGETCHDCDGPLWTALDVDTASPEVAEALAHTAWHGRLRVDVCHRCDFTADVIYREVAPDGSCRRSPHSPSGAGEEADPPTARLAVGEPAGRFPGGSAIGGLPVWRDDARYPACPDCGRTMDYIAQIDLGDPWDDFLDGRLTFFLHGACGLAGMFAQG